jgi:Leu/Phe-tRNA-protein transferase
MIYIIDPQALKDEKILKDFIYANLDENYYVAYDTSIEFYIALAKAGFISTACYDRQNNFILLPEMQFEYALLYFNKLHISKKVQQLLHKNNFDFKVNTAFNDVLTAINAYHKQAWSKNEYTTLLKKLYGHHDSYFKLISFELFNTQKELIAGEVGYIIGRTYTSLTGFFKREKAYNNWGKLQLTLTAHYLQQQGFDFWNLGHVCMPYKLDLGATIFSREQFLALWQKSTQFQIQ